MAHLGAWRGRKRRPSRQNANHGCVRRIFERDVDAPLRHERRIFAKSGVRASVLVGAHFGDVFAVWCARRRCTRTPLASRRPPNPAVPNQLHALRLERLRLQANERASTRETIDAAERATGAVRHHLAAVRRHIEPSEPTPTTHAITLGASCRRAHLKGDCPAVAGCRRVAVQASILRARGRRAAAGSEQRYRRRGEHDEERRTLRRKAHLPRSYTRSRRTRKTAKRYREGGSRPRLEADLALVRL